ncbi:hypothetical protein GCM10009789_21500 [Kribbella sancticallisti]|uniref:Uncharacterized protein n=1 Tax=Kribbella sancticallisti TaxID=460087 RepID=A0ABN2CZY0_9ACTN
MSHSTRTGFSAHDPGEAEPAYPPYERTLLRLGEEEPIPSPGCREEPCAKPEIGPVDLYCPDHERLIPFSKVDLGRARWFVVNLLRAAACGAVVLAALTENSIPLFLLFVVAGLAVAAAPLYRYPLTWKVAAGAWLVAGLVAALLPLLGPATESVLRAVLAGLVLVLAVVHTGAFAWSRQKLLGAAAPAVTLAAFAVVPAMALGWLLSHPSVGFTSVPAWLRNWLLVGTVTALAGMVLIAAIAGAIQGQSRVDRSVLPITAARAVPWQVDWKAATHRGSCSARKTPLERALNEFATRASAAVVAAARGVANLLLRAAHIVQVVVVRLINWVHRRLVMGVRRFVAAIKATGAVLAEAARLGRPVLARTARVVVLPALMVAIGAAAAVVGAEYALRYLLGEGLVILAPLAAAIVAGLVALTLLWMSLAGLSLRVSVDSWLHSVSVATPQVIVMFTLGGWIVGLPGTLGHGPITLGPVTITSTVLLLAVFAWARWTGNDEVGDTADSARPPVAPAGKSIAGGR